MPVPELSDDARREALKKAVEARRARAELREALKDGRLQLREALDRAQGDEVLGRMRVSAILEAMPGIGKVRARRVMEKLDISPSRRLRGLGVNQRHRLLEAYEHGEL